MDICYSGIDEAGMGPLLGPMSIARCSVLGPENCDLKAIFSDNGIPVADSKKIHQSGKPEKLERVALGAIQWFTGTMPKHASEVFDLLQEDPALRNEIPWMQGAEQLTLPIAATEIPLWHIPELQPHGASGCLLHPRHINSSYQQGVNKLSLELNSILDLLNNLPTGAAFYSNAVDRLGGRAYYADAIANISSTQVDIVSEEKGTSHYRYHYGSVSAELAFLVKGEDRNPLIASASCIAKYARELHMHLLNNYWTQQLNWLKHTAGYPQDAKRWLFQLGEGYVKANQFELVRGTISDLFTVS